MMALISLLASLIDVASEQAKRDGAGLAGMSISVDITTALSTVSSACVTIGGSLIIVAKILVNYMRARDESERRTFDDIFKRVEKMEKDRLDDERVRRQENLQIHTAVLEIQEKSVTGLGVMAQQIATLNGELGREVRGGKRGGA